MKIGKKLIIGFMVIASLVGFVGIFSVISHNNIQTNSKIITKVLELDILLDESLVKLLALVQTENIEDYIREKTDYEEIRTKFDALFKQLNNEYAKKLPDLGFNIKTFRKDAGELAKISNRLIALHKRKLAKIKAFKERKGLEQELLHKIRMPILALKDLILTNDIGFLQYHSKETLFQYKDQEHLDQWLERIQKIKNNPLVASLPDILNDLNSYERISQGLGEIILEQKTIETQEHLVFRELQELINRLEENQARIVNKIKAESQALARNTHLTMFVVIAGAFLVSIILGLTIARSISKPVAYLAQTTQAIAQGDFSVRVDVATADEIGELATSFNKMTEDLQKTTTSMEKLNAANQQLESEIAERKKAEKELERLNENLEDTIAKLGRANSELKDFVYIASHDLREPLRKISSFGELLSSSLKDKLNDDEKENLGFMVDGATRMQQMIEALLTYSRVTTRGAEFETVDLNKVMEELRSVELAVKIEEIGAKIMTPEQLHNVNCDPAQIRQLMQNLIANGLKYQKEGVVPEITIRSSVTDNDMIRVEVTDNGIGIKQEQFKDVFVMFKRLHSRREYEGTGIGLAVCKKIVERHGGDIGVSSTYGQGATFWFTLPALKTPVEKQSETSVALRV